MDFSSIESQKDITNSTSSSDYEDELNDVVGDFDMNMRKFSTALKQNFTINQNELKRSDYEPFDADNTSSTVNTNRKNSLEKLKNKTRKIPESLRRVSFG